MSSNGSKIINQSFMTRAISLTKHEYDVVALNEQIIPGSGSKIAIIKLSSAIRLT